jgi:hypothetical protein
MIRVHLLQKFAQDDLVRIRCPKKNLQVKIIRSLPGHNEFVSYVDALGVVDGTECLIDWKTTTSRYPEEREDLLTLDPQLICYSWISGAPDVALVVFVRKQLNCMEMICADFLAGATFDKVDPETFSVSVRRLVEFLPESEKLKLIEELKRSA